MDSWLPALCLTPCSSHLHGASLARAEPALEPQPFPGPASVPCLAPVSWRGINSTEIPMWEACSAAGGEQLGAGLRAGLGASQERSQRGDDGDFGDRAFGEPLPSLLNTCSLSQSEGGMNGNSLSQLTSRMAPCPFGPQAQLA